MNNFYLLELRNSKKQVLLVVSILSKIHGLQLRLKWILQEVSSIVTDGTNMNSGERDGLWVLLEKLRQQQVPEKESIVPLIKIWCAAHHSNLAWKSVTNTVTELKVVIEELKSISTYFHTSGVRTWERKVIADEHYLPVRRYPYTFKSTSQSSFLSSQMPTCHLGKWHSKNSSTAMCRTT